MGNSVIMVFGGTAALKAAEAVVKASKAGSIDADDNFCCSTGHEEEVDDDWRQKPYMDNRSNEDAS